MRCIGVQSRNPLVPFSQNETVLQSEKVLKFVLDGFTNRKLVTDKKWQKSANVLITKVAASGSPAVLQKM